MRLCLLILALCVQASQSIRCFKCDSNQGDCSADTCQGVWCVANIIEDRTSGSQQIHKDCAASNPIGRQDDGCAEDPMPGGSKSYRCACKSDSCNEEGNLARMKNMLNNHFAAAGGGSGQSQFPSGPTSNFGGQQLVQPGSVNQFPPPGGSNNNNFTGSSSVGQQPPLSGFSPDQSQSGNTHQISPSSGPQGTGPLTPQSGSQLPPPSSSGGAAGGSSQFPPSDSSPQFPPSVGGSPRFPPQGGPDQSSSPQSGQLPPQIASNPLTQGGAAPQGFISSSTQFPPFGPSGGVGGNLPPFVDGVSHPTPNFGSISFTEGPLNPPFGGINEGPLNPPFGGINGSTTSSSVNEFGSSNDMHATTSRPSSSGGLQCLCDEPGCSGHCTGSVCYHITVPANSIPNQASSGGRGETEIKGCTDDTSVLRSGKEVRKEIRDYKFKLNNGQEVVAPTAMAHYCRGTDYCNGVDRMYLSMFLFIGALLAIVYQRH